MVGMREKLQCIGTVKTSRVWHVVSKAPDTGRVGKGVLKAATHHFKGDDGLSEECKNDVSKGKSPPVCLHFSFCEVMGLCLHCVCLDQDTAKNSPRNVRERWRP